MILAFLAAAIILTITPGPDTALVMRTAVNGANRRLAVLTSLGIGAGLLVWGVLTAAGVSALVAASPVAYDVLRVAGAAWLVVMGVKALWPARRTHDAPEETTTPRSARRAVTTGLSTNLLNPKLLVFYLSLLPQFVPDGAPVFA
ncbi:LysE family translocator [Thermoactinospora rubra]|uniref:LysE family translocator n=1 Tax=Thermoactinospora rubra TaxID=1088767 RepID=UPI00198254E4|nr:LysE family translocator [Thermoactinospora rubra]